MSISNFNLRGIPPELMVLLKHEAKKLDISVNILILKLIENGLGFSRELQRPIYHDLDHLAGSWSSVEAKTFEENTKYFEQIDEALWS